ncbi:hypothetical protein [Sphingobacterium chungjuense]|uniref:hypothetical protein n=1 Tax=Sphingobacterium chungjuense TaxID=2675553 RepID=UPI00140905CA|nr:hypothetical protein [Sphingobacterium chungjuense]
MKKVIWIAAALLLVEIGFQSVPVASSHAVPAVLIGIARPIDGLEPMVDSLSQQLQQLSTKIEIMWDVDLPP